MNRYPLWKYAVMLVALVIGLVYTLPNLFGEAPAVQVSSGKATVKLDSTTLSAVEAALAANQIKPDEVTFDNSSTNANIRVRLPDTDTQLRVKDLLQKSLNSDPTDPQFIVALNLQSASPRWLTALHALPMYLGLDSARRRALPAAGRHGRRAQQEARLRRFGCAHACCVTTTSATAA